MNYAVVWSADAETDYVHLWEDESFRVALRAAVDKIEDLLASDPIGSSESRAHDLRILLVLPLVVTFEVDEAARRIVVLALWRARRTR